jgi:hypothetical protein
MGEPMAETGYTPNPEITEIENKEHAAGHTYPDYEFEFNDTFFKGTKNTPRALDGPSRGTLRALGNTVPDLEHLTDYEVRKRHESRFRSYFSQSVSLSSGKQKRKDVLDTEEAAQQVLSTLADENHPVYQAIKQVESRYKETLTERDIKQLATDVLCFTHWKDMRKQFNSQLAAQK